MGCCCFLGVTIIIFKHFKVRSLHAFASRCAVVWAVPSVIIACLHWVHLSSFFLLRGGCAYINGLPFRKVDENTSQFLLFFVDEQEPFLCYMGFWSLLVMFWIHSRLWLSFDIWGNATFQNEMSAPTPQYRSCSLTCHDHGDAIESNPHPSWFSSYQITVIECAMRQCNV